MSIRWWFGRARRERELSEELEAHFAMATRDRIARGESASDAGLNARREFGNEALIREVTREMWGYASLDRVLADSKYALRVLRRNPGFALTAVACLALGIAATTATFSIADAALLRPLPIRNPSEVVVVSAAAPDTSSAGLSYRDLQHLREHATSFAGLVGFQLSPFTMARSADEVPYRRMGMFVAGDFFDVLGVRAATGRTFTHEETNARDKGAVVVLGDEFWQSEFSGDPNVVGRSVRVNGAPFTIIGVAPKGFSIHPNLRPAYYVPFTMVRTLSPNLPHDPLEASGDRRLQVRARLNPGVTKEAAREELIALGRSLAQLFPDTHARHVLALRTELEERMREAPALAVVSVFLVVLASFVLLIACANVASLLLARAQARSREIAIRLSIGAGRGRLMQQFLTESLVLSLAAGTAGVLLAYGAIRYLASIQIPTDTPIVLAVALDHRALAFALFASVLTAVLSGVAPAWRSLSPNIAPVLKTGEAAGRSRKRALGRNGLVVAQVALSVVLLVVSGMLLDAFRRMLISDPGIRTDRLMMVEFDPSLVHYTPEQTRQFFGVLSERARALPGARSAALTRGLPFRPNFTEEAIVPEGYQFPANQRSVTVSSNVVDQSYFATMGVAIAQGRAFDASDTEQSRKVAIVNQEFANRYWPAQNALAKRFRLGVNGPWLEVVGITPTGKYLSLAEAPQPYFYLPFSQHLRPRMTLLVETAGDAASMAAPILELVRSLDPNQPVYNIREMKRYFEQGVLGLNLTAMQMVWAMGAAGLVLAAIGLYGLISFSVARRTREIGIRMAIGADRSRVVWMVLRQGLILSGTGTTLGMLLSIPAFHALSAGLAGLGPLSAWTLAIVPAGLILVGLTAAYVPAWRASRIDPTLALRAD